MIPALRKKLWIYNNGNRRIESGYLASQLLGILYPESKKTVAELSNDTKKNVKRALQKLKKRHLVIQNNQDWTYSLTDLGIWFAISHKLGVSFVELCALACACCVQQRYASSGKIGFYMQSTFEGIFKEYYSKGYISDVFSSLRSKGFAVKYVKKTLRIYPKTWEDLMATYGEQFKKLESWLDELQEKELDVFSRILDGFEMTAQA
ncbi:MAG: hypothetical protein WBF38_04990 [Nitrosotalea sp.]